MTTWYHLISPSESPDNKLEVAIVEEFAPRFAPGAQLVYLGDTANKVLVFEKNIFTKFGISTSEHGKLPDVILYDKKRNWLFLIEATFKKFANDIAWETEVWVAETPSHMIHFNGDKFLGPR